MNFKFLLKYKRAKNFLKKWGIVKSMLFQGKREIVEALKNDRLYQERRFLESKIREKAHYLEKQVKNLHGPSTNASYDKIASKELKLLLLEWEKLKLPPSESIKWAQKILGEYERYIKTGWTCNLTPQEKEIKRTLTPINLLNFMKERRSIRKWKATKVKRTEINMLVEAAKWAPSACNRQTWHFIAVEDENLIRKVILNLRRGAPFFSRAPLIIMVLVDSRPYGLPQEKHTPYQDAAAAIQNMLLMAHSLGLGACWVSYTSYTGMTEEKKEKKIRAELKIPDYFKIAGIVAVGKPAERVCVIPRKDNSEILSFGKFP